MLLNAFKRIKKFLIVSYYTLNGWRFDDLKKFIVSVNKEVNCNLNLPCLIDGVVSSRADSSTKNAFVSAMPPAETGVANCNFITLAEGNCNVDIFSDFEGTESVAAIEARGHGRMQAYHVECLPLFVTRRKYDNLVISIGNSDHDVFAVMAMKRFTYNTVCKNVSLHLHDLVLLNVATKIASLSGKSLLDAVIDTYTDVDHNELRKFASGCDEHWRFIEGLVDRGIYGARMIIEMVKPTRIIVNSSFAAEMLHKDYGLQGCPLPVVIAYHPIFRSAARLVPYQQWRNDIELRLGTFGIASKAKCTDVIILACKELNKIGIKTRLVMAGYNVHSYYEKNSDLFTDVSYELHDKLTDDELCKIMDSVHLAVQLRKRNLGESSGVIASLIMKSVPTIVTATGAFNDYANCCIPVKTDITPFELALVIQRSISDLDYATLRRKMELYAAEHSPGRLCDIFFSNR